MRSSVRLAVVSVAVVALVVGAFIGLRPITAPLTQISPEVRTLSVPCGIGYLPGVPGTSDLVPLPSDPSVVLPHNVYAEHCATVSGWRPILAWGLTGLGLAGIAVLFAGRRDRPGGSPLGA